MTELQAFLESERKRLNKPKQAYEAELGLAAGTFSRWRTPQEKTLVKLAKHFGRPIADLRRMAATEVEDTTERSTETPHRYPLVEERLVWARAKKVAPALIEMFLARVGAVFKGEPTEADVDAAWAHAERRHAQFEGIELPKAKVPDPAFGSPKKRG